MLLGKKGETAMSEYPPQYAPSGQSKPGKVQAIAIMCLVDGILNILWGLGLIVSLLATIVCWPIGIYPIVLGILEIIYAAKLLPEPPTTRQPAKYLAIMQICNIIVGDFISLVVGIVSLVFFNDPEVVSYFASVSIEPPAESL
jgi:hypothetical protein